MGLDGWGNYQAGGGGVYLLTTDSVVSSRINGCFEFIFVLGSNYILCM